MKFVSLMFCLMAVNFHKSIVHSKSLPNAYRGEERGIQFAEGSDTAEEISDNLQSLHESYHPKKRHGNNLRKRSAHSKVSIHDSGPKKRTCGIMYRNREPIGILQPFEESYKLIPVKQNKISFDMNELQPSKQSYFDNVYPRKASENEIIEEVQDENVRHKEKRKRNAQQIMNSKSNLEKANDLGETSSVEEQLKDILDDMGLIDDVGNAENKQEKRALREDENLEEGENNISMIKDDNDSIKKENKRNVPERTKCPFDSNLLVEDDASASKNDESNEKKVEISSNSDIRKRNAKKFGNAKVDAERKLNFLLDSVKWKARSQFNSATPRDFQSDFVRQKRDDSTTRKIIEDLTNSGDLSVSGNKSPLAYMSSKDAENNSDLTEYEKRVQRHIQEKIRSLKEEVKREIASLESSDKEKRVVNELIRKKRGIMDLSGNESKRDYKTLMDAEPSYLNPAYNVDGDMKPNIRRRRDVDPYSFLYETKDIREAPDIYGNFTIKTNLDSSSNCTPGEFPKTDTNKTSDAGDVKTTEIPLTNTSTAMPIGVFFPANATFTTDLGNTSNLTTTMATSVSIEAVGETTNSKTIKCKTNETEVDINLENGLQKIHISINTSPPSNQTQYKREISEKGNMYIMSDKINEDPQSKNKYHTRTETIQIDDYDDEPQYNTRQENQIQPETKAELSDDSVDGAPMKNEVKIDDGLPFNLKKRSCTSGNCGKNNAGDSCDCNSAGCTCGNNRKMRFDDYGDVRSSKMKTDEKRSDGEAEGEFDEEEFEDDNDYDMDNYPDRKDSIRRVLRGDKKAEYYVDMNPDTYNIAPYKASMLEDDGDYEDMRSRRKRNYFDDLVALHGGTATRNHMVAIKSRSMGSNHPRVRRRIGMESNDDPIQLIDMSDEDIFGALPQSYEGELGRYKRVKR